MSIKKQPNLKPSAWKNIPLVLSFVCFPFFILMSFLIEIPLYGREFESLIQGLFTMAGFSLTFAFISIHTREKWRFNLFEILIIYFFRLFWSFSLIMINIISDTHWFYRSIGVLLLGLYPFYPNPSVFYFKRRVLFLCSLFLCSLFLFSISNDISVFEAFLIIVRNISELIIFGLIAIYIHHVFYVKKGDL